MGLLSKNSRKSVTNVRKMSARRGAQITVGVTFPGRREAIKCYENDTVMELKEKVKASVGIPIEQQHMVYGGKKLKDHKTLKHYKVQDERTIILEGRFDQFLAIKPTDPTLSRLSQRLDLQRQADGTIVANKQINTGSKKSTIRGGKSMSTVNPATGDNVISDDSGDDEMMDVTSSIYVRMENTEVEVTIARRLTLADLKKDVLRLLKLDNFNHMVVVPPDAPLSSRDSFFAEEKLGTTIEEADLNGKRLLVRNTHVTFTVELPGKEVKKCTYDMDSTLEDFFDFLVDLERDNPDLEHLTLTNEGEELTRESTYREARIVNGSHLILAKMKEEGEEGSISFKVLHGPEFEKSIPFTLDPDTDMWDVLRLIEGKGGGHAQKIILEDEDGNELEDEGSLDDWGVGEGSVLKVIKVR